MLKRGEIVHEAKLLVLNHGPSNVLEFGGEIIHDHSYGQWEPSDVEAIRTEAAKQAMRVYKFLGYVSRFGEG